MMTKVGIIDYGSGNFTSVWNAVNSITNDVRVIQGVDDFSDCTHIILPGVGAFHAAIQKIQRLAIVDRLREDVLEKKKQFLGICVGMQVLATQGTEFVDADGLNLIPGKVVKFSVDSAKFSLPHIGWNTLSNTHASPLFRDIGDNATFYFVHSYHFVPSQNDVQVITSDYGGEFVSAISKGNIHGVQFHPEKSQFYGLKLLRNFMELTSC